MRKLSLIHLVIMLCLSVFAFSTHGTASQKDGLLKIHFFDVGQGDSIFIETPSGRQILVDGGPDNKVLSKLGEVIPFYDKDIDVVVVSHPHADHMVGLVDVLERYDVKNIVEAKESYNSSEFRAWEESVKNENANSIEAISGKIIDLGDGATLTILHPFESVIGDNPKNPHDDVVVAMLKYGELEVMLTGDMETNVERRLIMEGYDLDSDVLKVGHHGSKTSTSEEFLSAVSPEVAVIQVGAKNRYGHPSPEILNRLENSDIKYYRNDVDGDIKLVSDGTDFTISKY
ncbi:MAG: ComEC/Rec2 family competence protein [bacterium]|nr:ComEC/Rec2 family competence protein [bacterium]